jgi:hypothetical protein
MDLVYKAALWVHISHAAQDLLLTLVMMDAHPRCHVHV